MVKQATAPKQQDLDMVPIQSWDDVELEVERIAFLDIDIEESETMLNETIRKVTLNAADAIRRAKEQRAILEDRVLSFVKRHRKDFGDRKSKKLSFGTIGFSKAASKVVYLLEESQVVANLKRLGFALGVVKEIESIDKPALVSTVPEDKREKVGFEVVPTGDEPKLTIDRKSIELVRGRDKRKGKR